MEGGPNSYGRKENKERVMSRSGKGSDGVVGGQGVDQVGLDLHSSHGLTGAEGRGEDIVEARGERSDKIDLISQDAVIRDDRIAPGRATEVDEQRRERDLFCLQCLQTYKGLVDLVGE